MPNEEELAGADARYTTGMYVCQGVRFHFVQQPLIHRLLGAHAELVSVHFLRVRSCAGRLEILGVSPRQGGWGAGCFPFTILLDSTIPFSQHNACLDFLGIFLLKCGGC